MLNSGCPVAIALTASAGALHQNIGFTTVLQGNILKQYCAEGESQSMLWEVHMSWLKLTSMVCGLVHKAREPGTPGSRQLSSLLPASSLSSLWLCYHLLKCWPSCFQHLVPVLMIWHLQSEQILIDIAFGASAPGCSGARIKMTARMDVALVLHLFWDASMWQACRPLKELLMLSKLDKWESSQSIARCGQALGVDLMLQAEVIPGWNLLITV